MKTNLLSSTLYDNNTFYKAFKNDLLHAQHRVIIESPFITLKRMKGLMPILIKLRNKGITVIVNTRNPVEHSDDYYDQAVKSIQQLQEIGVKVLYTVKLHRKIAILDDAILWEGSLNILSQNDSCEIMRRTNSRELVKQMVGFISVYSGQLLAHNDRGSYNCH